MASVAGTLRVFESGSPSGPRLNLGCGPVMPPGWIHVDGSRRAWLVSHAWPLDRWLVRLGLLRATAFHPPLIHHDLRRGVPWPDASVAAIYAGELWEHLEPDDGRRLLDECHRALKPGGVLRVCVPDGVGFWQQYLALHEAERARAPGERESARLARHVGLYFADICTRPPGFKSFGHFHKWQYDEVQLVDLFTRAGFEEVGRERFHDSRIPGIAALERSDFLIVEGVKPKA